MKPVRIPIYFPCTCTYSATFPSKPHLNFSSPIINSPSPALSNNNQPNKHKLSPSIPPSSILSSSSSLKKKERIKKKKKKKQPPLMEAENNSDNPQPRSLSFRLRSPSLNTLRLRRVFDIFDQDSDGVITIPELSQALDRLGLGADPSDIASTVSSFIRPDHEGLEFEDFELLHGELGDALFGTDINNNDDETSLTSTKMNENHDGDMEEAFKVFDEDGDGFISAKELHAVLGKLGMEVSMTKVEDMIFSVDTNSDGRVDFGEFKNMMLGVSVLGV